ncbi:MAG: SDR family oxidoreductase [Armatimonadetes bacterium]|nr:SDR family oxidoreductase [Armatimonadota bacterium]
MDFQLSGKVAMVAAGSKGIGLAIARALSAEGVKVSICGRTQETLDASGMALSVRADVSNADELSDWHTKTLQKLGPVDILITNTGGPKAGNPSELTDEDWISGVDSTLLNVVRLTRLVQPAMAAKKWGRIVHLTSLVAKQPYGLLTISSTLRSGIIALTKLQAKELATAGITVNGLLPGHTLTDRQIHLVGIRAERAGKDFDEELAESAAKLPMGRFARPDEVANVAAFLCSSQTSYLSGQSICVDGATTDSLL